MTTDADLFSRRGTIKSTDEQARAAVAAFRRLQPTLSAYARVLTGGKHNKVEMSVKSNGETDGKTIYYRPPLALGTDRVHNRTYCDKRDAEKQLLCPACRVREEVLVTIYHEIAHIAYNSFAKTDDSDLKMTVSKTVHAHNDKISRQVQRRISEAPYWKKDSYINLASLVSPFFPFLVNCLEDARVNSEMFKARPGTKVMFDASTWAIFAHGVEQPDENGDIIRKHWRDYPLNLQVMIGCFCVVSGYEYSSWLQPDVVNDLGDEKLQKILESARNARNPKTVYEVSFDAYIRLRELGYCQTPEDSEAEEDEESSTGGEDSPEDSSEGVGEADSDGESGDGVADSEREDDNESEATEESDDDLEGTGSPSDAGPDDSDEENSDGDLGSPTGSSEASSDPEEGVGESGTGSETSEDGDLSDDPSGGSSGGSDETGAPEDGSEDPGDAEQSDFESGGDSGESEESDDSDGMEDASGNGGSTVPGETGGSGEEDADPGDSSGTGRDTSGEEAGGTDGDLEEQSPGEDVGDADGQSEGESSDDSGDLGSDSRHNTSRDSGDGGVESEPEGYRGDEESRERTDGGDHPLPGDQESEPTDSGTGDAESESDSDNGTEVPAVGGPHTESDASPVGEKVDDSEPVDTGADEGLGGATVLGSDESDEPDDVPDFGTPEEVEAYLQKMGHHDHATLEDRKQQTKEDEVLEIAIVQGMYFETPSSTILGVREHVYGQPVMESGHNWSEAWDDAALFAKMGRVASGKDADFLPREQILGPALLRMRRAFEDNARGGLTRNQKSGRVDARVLGKRAFHDDERLFRKKIKPGKRDYHVLIGLDISGSTVGENLMLIKRAAMAQAQMCHRLGISFSVYAHTGNIDIKGYSAGLWLEIYHIKDAAEPWSDAVARRLTDLGPSAANLDGHTIEYYRKAIEKVRATDKIIMYYTDGKMPAENFDEELEILQRELLVCRKQQIKVMGVGIRTDSPVRHGLDTVQVDTDEDLVKVVQHLEKIIK